MDQVKVISGNWVLGVFEEKTADDFVEERINEWVNEEQVTIKSVSLSSPKIFGDTKWVATIVYSI